MATTAVRARSLFETAIVKQAIVDSFRKLTVKRQVRNPVMFVVYVGSILTSLLWIQALVGKGEAPPWVIFWVSGWLWFTVLFANFAEAVAEGRGKAQAASLRNARPDRDRPGYPAGRADHRLPARHRHPAALLALQRRGRGPGHAGHGHRAGGPAGVPDSHHHRRPAVRHRHRGHGSDDPEERDRHVRSRGRGGRRRGRAPSRPDRHHHARPPSGGR